MENVEVDGWLVSMAFLHVHVDMSSTSQHQSGVVCLPNSGQHHSCGVEGRPFGAMSGPWHVPSSHCNGLVRTCEPLSSRQLYFAALSLVVCTRQSVRQPVQIHFASWQSGDCNVSYWQQLKRCCPWEAGAASAVLPTGSSSSSSRAAAAAAAAAAATILQLCCPLAVVSIALPTGSSRGRAAFQPCCTQPQKYAQKIVHCTVCYRNSKIKHPLLLCVRESLPPPALSRGGYPT
jgi:hypothetical protein